MSEDAQNGPVARKPRRRKDARPGEILAAGIAEFEAHGFKGANLNRIAKAAGISKGTIYLYFPSKEALFLAAIEEHVTAVMGETETDLATFEGTTRELLTRLLVKMYGRFVTGQAQALFRILLTEGDRMPDVIASYHAMTISRGTTLLTSILTRGVKRGEVRDTAVLKTPNVIIAPAVYFSIHNMMFGHAQPLSFDAYFEAHVDMLLNGVLREEAPSA
ncbi:MAG: TetR/AcrR family transcriptional regulator [Pseudomonadota bacterium]